MILIFIRLLIGAVILRPLPILFVMDIVESCERVHELLKNPRVIGSDDLLMLLKTFHIEPMECAKRMFCEDGLNALDVFVAITGMSKGEGRRKNVRMSELFDTHAEGVKFGVLYIGKKEMEVFFVLSDGDEERMVVLDWEL